MKRTALAKEVRQAKAAEAVAWSALRQFKNSATGPIVERVYDKWSRLAGIRADAVQALEDFDGVPRRIGIGAFTL